MGRLALAFIVLASLAQDQSVDPSEPSDRGTIAVLRRDGVIFPFAAFDRDKWSVPWPVNLASREIPVTRAAIPERWWGPAGPGAWRAIVSGRVQPIELGGPAFFSTVCGRRLGLQTTYSSALPMPEGAVQPFPKDGIAVRGDISLEPIESVSEDSKEWSTLTADLTTYFDRVEKSTIGGVKANTGWKHTVDERERRKLPIRIESWYRTPAREPGWTVSYIEAVRQYPPGPNDNGCGLETLVSGWVHHQDGKLVKADGLRGKITYCDRVGATYMLPFGRFDSEKRSYWIFQLSGWEDEWYEVAEVGPKKARVVVEVYAGGRQTCLMITRPNFGFYPR